MLIELSESDHLQRRIFVRRNEGNPGNQKPDEGQHHRPVDNQELFELNSSDDNEIQVLDVIVMHQASANNGSLDEPLDSLVSRLRP